MIDIRCTRVGHSFFSPSGEIEVLKDISFDVRKGESLIIVGPSGCGKTTLLRLLLGLDVPKCGHIDIDPERLKGGVAFVPQSAQMLPWRSALQNACIGVELRTDLDDASVNGLRAEFDHFGLRGFEDASWKHLSGGMRQKVALIAALSSRPELLFCDEPFSAIDFVSRLRLLSDFKMRCTALGVTQVSVTHNIEEAIFLADRILLLSRRPARIIETYEVDLGTQGFDAVACRETQEFKRLFHDIWRKLNG